MKNKRFLRNITAVVIVAVGCGYAIASAVKSNISIIPGQLELTCRLTAKALEKNHLRKQPQDVGLSSRIYDEYFKMLDPGFCYFTKHDIVSFGKDRFRLLDEINNGELRAVYAIYDRYLERLREYRAHVEKLMQEGISFDVDESFTTDRKNLGYCADDKALKELWRKRLKNDLLYYRLMQKVMEERSKDPAVQADLKKRWFQKSPEDKVRSRLHDQYNNAVQADKMDILGIFLSAMAQVYGPHSHYSTPKQDEDFDIQFKLSLSGIGATLTSEDGYVKIVDLVPGGPADKNGKLKPEDRIIAVTQEKGDPVDVIDMSVSNAVKLIRGPAGSKVTLTVLSSEEGPGALPKDITITRGKVELKENAASGKIETVTIPGKAAKRIGVIKLNNFYMDFEGAAKGLPDYRSCTRDVRKILSDFNAAKVDAVIIDLRSNSGGSLPEAISMSGLFITQGPIVQVVDADNNLDVHNDPDRQIAYSGPLVLMVSKFSASSSEILAGAMQDYRRALLVGDSRTYGKGTVLSVTDLSRLVRFVNSKLSIGSLTHEIAMFYRINGQSNQARGIQPDIILPSFTESMEIGEIYNDNHLPWQAIKPLDVSMRSFTGYRMLTKEIKDKLAASSNLRLKSDPALLRLQKDAERFKQIRDRKSVSLNEKQRLKEYYDEKAASDQMEKIMENTDKTTDKKSAKNDTLLQETLRIAAEYSTLLNAGK